MTQNIWNQQGVQNREGNVNAFPLVKKKYSTIIFLKTTVSF